MGETLRQACLHPRWMFLGLGPQYKRLEKFDALFDSFFGAHDGVFVLNAQ